MIVKFFPKPTKGGGGSSSIDYLLDEKKHNGADNIKILQGDPELSRNIAESLDFATNYTVGCLSFEEENIPEHQKSEIMERFEQSIFSGLDKEQYNILWIEHTDKDRLELNFFIPNVELTSGKRLQPYYDKADRPIAENFKQVINHEYQLTDPNAPEKQQTLITKEKLPSNKKEALQAIDEGLTALATRGEITNRKDVINALEGAGFEIARITPKNISIKTEGQNLRLKGAYYDENFRCGESLQETINGRSRDYQREREERYQTARERLNSTVSKREREFKQRYPNRAGEIDKELNSIMEIANADNGRNMSNSVSINGGSSVAQQERLPRDERVENISRLLSDDKQENQRTEMHDTGQQIPVLREDRHGPQGTILGKKRQSSIITNKSGEITNDRERETIRERIERAIRKARAKFDDFSERISNFKSGKRLDKGAIRTNNDTKQTNQRTISDIDKINQALKQQQKQQRNERGRGFSM